MSKFKLTRGSPGLIALAGALVLGSCEPAHVPTATSVEDELEAVSENGAQVGLNTQGRYIVLFERNEPDPPGLARGLGQAHGFSPVHIYRTAAKGFSARMSQQAVEALRRNPRIQLIEPDAIATATESGTQTDAIWGLDRIDQRDGMLDGTYSWGNDGSGVHAYILDTGIRTTHEEFEGRASFEVDFTTDPSLPYDGDCEGHGTHVAGTVGSATYGVAKNVDLHAVRVLDCGGSGAYSWIMAGIDWVADHQNGNGDWPAIINMSLSGPQSDALDAIVQGAVDDGVVVVSAAGNNYGADACSRSPAAAANGLTVGSTTSSDARSSFSNIGTCVDLFAPGSSILSTTKNSTTSTGYKSGTSMAAPHVAGVAALYLGHDPALTPYQVMSGIEENATSGVVSNPGTGSPNLLLFSEVGTVPPPPPPPPPLADITIHVDALSVTVAWGKRNSNGTALVTVRDKNGATVADATVTGDWWAKESVQRSGASGNTDVTGVATIGSGALKNVREGDPVQFCVTGISGANMIYDPSANDPSDGCAGPGGVEPPPPPSGPFTLSASVKAGKRVNLSWTGSEAMHFDIYRAPGAVIEDVSGSTYTETPGPDTWVYTVCEANTQVCTNDVEVTTKR